jgi:hypothetical protein
MHGVNKIKSYLNFHVNNLKFLNKVQIIFISEHTKRNNYE